MNTKSIDETKENRPLVLQTSKKALEGELALRLLSAIEGDQSVTQRSLALRFGIAVGLANVYIKRCVHKGWIKVRQVPTKRYAYFLTPTGFSEKSRLVGEYLTSSLGFYRRARTQYADCLTHAKERGWQQLALVGAGDLAEIATLAALESPVDLKLVIAPGHNEAMSAGLKVTTNIKRVKDFDAVLLTDIKSVQATYEALRQYLPDDRILAPQLLRLTRRPDEAGK